MPYLFKLEVCYEVGTNDIKSNREMIEKMLEMLNDVKLEALEINFTEID